MCGLIPPSERSHYPSRGSGGKARHQTPKCRKHHRELDGINSGPITFQAKYEIDLADIAAYLYTMFHMKHGAPDGEEISLQGSVETGHWKFQRAVERYERETA